jgi:hypothetical protein
MRALSLLVLAIAGLAHAAPAPLPQREQGPEYPPVLLNGWLPEQHLTRNPSVIVCQSDYQAAAKALGIQDPPRVNFRTHFLFIHISSGYGQVTCAIDGNGDLRAAAEEVTPSGRSTWATTSGAFQDHLPTGLSSSGFDLPLPL